MVKHLGGPKKAGAKLKSKTGWKLGGNGTNSSGFTALPAGGRGVIGTFGGFGKHASFWTSTEKDGKNALSCAMFYGTSGFHPGSNLKGSAFSCRCVRD